MDYEKAYKEALERARNIRFGNPNSATANVVCEEIFPELAESEDEKIRKEVEKAAKDWYRENYEGENPQGKALMISAYIDGAIAWLEKQGETFTKRDVDDAYLKGICDAKRELEKQGEQKQKQYDIDVLEKHITKDYISELAHTVIVRNGWEIVDTKEQKPANKPKFKVGDRVNKNDREDEEYNIITITSVNVDEHCYICNQCSVIDFEEQDLWHIVEQKPAWSEDDEIGYNASLWAIKQARTIAKNENDMSDLWYAERWLKSLKDRVQPQQKQEWSEEDEKMLNQVKQSLYRYQDHLIGSPLADDVEIEINWLKSLKK